MNIDYFASFVETAKQKSIFKASQNLNITHTALSKQIRRVEDYFGVALFTRSTSGVSLTEAGDILYRRIEPILEEMALIQADMNKFSEKKSIVLGTLPSLAAHYLPKKIMTLQEKGIEVEIVVRNTSLEIFDLLKSGTVNTAVIERLPVHKSFWITDLFEESFYAVLPQNHQLFCKEYIAVANLATEPLVLYPAECHVRKTMTSVFAKHNIVPTIRTEVAFGDFLLGYVAAGAGITVLPKTAVEHLGHNTLKALPIRDTEAKRTISLICASEQYGFLLRKYFKQ
jgi:LysR family transcriptional regulator, transcription activator of glutamate synthase operon